MLSYFILFSVIGRQNIAFLHTAKAITLALKTHLTTHMQCQTISTCPLTHTAVCVSRSTHTQIHKHTHKHTHATRITLQGVYWHFTTAYSVMTLLSLPDTSQTDWLLIFKTADNEFKARPLALAYL